MRLESPIVVKYIMVRMLIGLGLGCGAWETSGMPNRQMLDDRWLNKLPKKKQKAKENRAMPTFTYSISRYVNRVCIFVQMQYVYTFQYTPTSKVVLY